MRRTRRLAYAGHEPILRSRPLDKQPDAPLPLSSFQIEIVRTPEGPPLAGKPVALMEPDLRAIVAAGVVTDQQIGLLRLKGVLWTTGSAAEALLADAREYGDPVLVPHPRLAGERCLLADLAVEMLPHAWQALALLTEGQERLLRRLDLRPGDPPTKLLFRRPGGRWSAVPVDPADWPDLLTELVAGGRQRYRKA